MHFGLVSSVLELIRALPEQDLTHAGGENYYNSLFPEHFWC